MVLVDGISNPIKTGNPSGDLNFKWEFPFEDSGVLYKF